MAHAKTEVISARETQIIRNGERVRHPETWWERHSTIHYAKRYLDDTESIITAIHQNSGQEGPSFGILGIGAHSGTLL